MIDRAGSLYFDFTDPMSYLVDRELEVAELDLELVLERKGFELRPPPLPLSGPLDPVWANRWEASREIASERGLRLGQPQLVPWSRKAHELHLHASSLGQGALIRRAIFHAFFVEGRDIGRVDVLVGIARASDLDLTETKAVLDVDRYQPDLVEARRVALEAGIERTPTIVWGELRLEGFHNRITLSTLLARA